MKRTSITRITTSLLILLTVALASATAQTSVAKTVAFASVAGAQAPAGAQTKPPASLELAPCQEITQLMENGDPVNKKSFRFALGWWSRGFLEVPFYPSTPMQRKNQMSSDWVSKLQPPALSHIAMSTRRRHRWRPSNTCCSTP